MYIEKKSAMFPRGQSIITNEKGDIKIAGYVGDWYAGKKNKNLNMYTFDFKYFNPTKILGHLGISHKIQKGKIVKIEEFYERILEGDVYSMKDDVLVITFVDKCNLHILHSNGRTEVMSDIEFLSLGFSPENKGIFGVTHYLGIGESR